MIKEAVFKCLKSADPSEAFRGFQSELEKYRSSEPTLYNGFLKIASQVIGEDYLIDCFQRSASRNDVTLIQTIEKKASDQKITRAEILNYIQQGGLSEVLEKNALAINGHINSVVKPGLEKFAAGGINAMANSVKTSMNLPGMKNIAGNIASRPKVGTKLTQVASPANMRGLQATPNLAKSIAPPGQSFAPSSIAGR